MRFFVSDHILGEVRETLLKGFKESRRVSNLAKDAVLRRAKLVVLPHTTEKFVADDPEDDAIVQTGLTAKADYLITADKVLLQLGHVRDLQIISMRMFAELLPEPP